MFSFRFRTQTDHEGDLSDGISVISDTDSNRQTPLPSNVDHEQVSGSDECEMCQRKSDLNSIENVSSTLDHYSGYRYEQRQTHTTVQSDTHPPKKLNKTIILGIIASITAIIVACYVKSIAIDEAVHPLIKFLSHRVDRLEADNIALKMEVTRILDIIGPDEKFDQHQMSADKYHKKDDMKRSPDTEYHQKPHHKQKKVWIGDGHTLETAAEVPTEKTVDYCKRNLDGENDLYAEYNHLKCEQQKRKEEFYKNEKKYERKSENYRSDHDEEIDVRASSGKEYDFKTKTVPKYEKDVPTKYREKQGGKNHRPYDAKSDNDWLSDSNAKGEYGSRQHGGSSHKNHQSKEQNDSRRKLSSKKERKPSEYSESDYKSERVEKPKKDKYRSKDDSQRKGDDANWYLDRGAEREKSRTNQAPSAATKNDKHNKYQSEY